MARTVRGAIRDDFGIAAGSIAFAAFLAIVPMAGLIVNTYAMLASPDHAVRHAARLAMILPAEAQRLILRVLDVAAGGGSEGIVTTVASLALALFSARRAGRSLLHGINLAYRVRQERRGLRRVVVSTVLVMVCAALVVTTLVSLSVIAFLQSYVPDGLPGARLASQAVLLATLTLGAAAGLVLIYRYAPACAAIAWRRALPGTAFAVTSWVAATLLLRVYVTDVARFSDAYGSLSAVVVLMLWLLVSAWILLLGARFNAEVLAAAGEVIEERDA